MDKMETASIRMTEEKETEEVKLEKKKRFWDFLTMILSISYAILLLVLGMNTEFFTVPL